MPDALLILLGGAATVGVVHTAIGVDHTLPFVVLAKARGWTLRRTLWVTAGCGLVHVATSLLLGGLGALAGFALADLQWVQALRGDAAAWLLVAFGAVYALHGLRRVGRGVTHDHVHAHDDGTVHGHVHDHHAAHAHVHGEPSVATTWGLFLIFGLGPCEALIPMIMASAAQGGGAWSVAVALVFALSTLLTMLGVVTLGVRGLRSLSLPAWGRFADPLAGAAVASSGLAILFLGV